MHNYDVVTIGSTLVDIFIKSDEFSVKKTSDGLMLCELLGDKVEVDELIMTSGGGASNAAVGFARQGFQTAIISELGKDALAEKVLRDLQEESTSRYCCGTFISPEKKKKLSASLRLKDEDTIVLRVKKGWFSKSIIWKRI